MPKKTNPVYVLKFGGSSVANIAKIKRVAKIIARHKSRGLGVVVVVSAMGDTTDELLELALRLNPNPPERELDMLISTGEQVSAALLAMALAVEKIEAVAFSGYQAGVLTDPYHTKARILEIEPYRLKRALSRGKVVVVAGFQGKTAKDDVSTLGRGGSDLSAVALAHALKAERCIIYTDVEGVFTADPRIVKEAKKINCISFDEMLELASKGAQVMQARAVEVAKKYNITLEVRSSFSDKMGTVIKSKRNLEEAVVRGVGLTEKEAKITICNLPDRPGIAAEVFQNLSLKNINVDMIVQNVSRNKITDISFTVEKAEAKKAFELSQKIAKKIGAGTVLYDEDIAKVSIVGIGMRSHSGVAAKMFKVLAKNKVNIEMISTSEISISCVVRKKEGRIAAQVLHKAFNLGKK